MVLKLCHLPVPIPVKNKVEELLYVDAIPTIESPAVLNPTLTVAIPIKSSLTLHAYKVCPSVRVDIPPPLF